MSYTSATAEKESTSLKNSTGVSHLKKDINQAANDAKMHAGKVGADLKEVAEEAGHQVRHMMDNAGNDLSHVADKLAAEVRERPVQSTLITLAVGAFLGAIFLRR
jgi:ElaB/YqjD/DUF883 family membrane-anchored ribosome-binding protein